jgi:hypothetical protein
LTSEWFNAQRSQESHGNFQPKNLGIELVTKTPEYYAMGPRGTDFFSL